jgi:hypothetical protein
VKLKQLTTRTSTRFYSSIIRGKRGAEPSTQIIAVQKYFSHKKNGINREKGKNRAAKSGGRAITCGQKSTTEITVTQKLEINK